MTNYIHYGADKFDPMSVSVNPFLLQQKPAGLWASPVDSDWSWKDWCECEGYHTESLKKSFTFALDDSAKVLHVYRLKDVEGYLEPPAYCGLNMEKLCDDYDAMELHMSENYAELKHSFLFNCWDCDSIVVWNYDKIVVN